MGKEPPSDRDTCRLKRIKTSGSLLYDLFREYYLVQKKNIILQIDKARYETGGEIYRNNLHELMANKKDVIFGEQIVEDGIHKGFKGNWGSAPNTKKVGIVQSLDRLSWFTHMSHLRKIVAPLNANAKMPEPHKLHSTHWGLIDPVDTPDGAHVGTHKHLAITTLITHGLPSEEIIKWLTTFIDLKPLTHCFPSFIAKATKVFVNGNWVGVTFGNPVCHVHYIKQFRRNGRIPMQTSVSFHYGTNIIYIYTDGGRLIRPILYRNIEDKSCTKYTDLSYQKYAESKITEATWSQLVSGFADDNHPHPELKTKEDVLKFCNDNGAVIDYIDTSEEESALIALKIDDICPKNKYYTPLIDVWCYG